MRSPKRFSCGMALSTSEIILVCPLLLSLLAIVPKDGPMNGNQKRMTTKSGRSFLSLFPSEIQLNGLTELITERIFTPCGALRS